MIRLLPAFLALCAVQAAAQAPLKLPSSQGEIRALLRETNDPICLRCGVVTSVRTVSASGPEPQMAGPMAPGSSGLDDGVGTVPFGTERAKAERERLRKEPGQRYEVVVRYDDGTVGRLDLGSDPKLQPGDRVKVDGGRVERYP